jgi:1-acyl-sn-glycerol-3-phosphate acyltransferase
MPVLKHLGLILANVTLWLFFIVTSTILVIGALVIRLVTLPFDPNLRLLQQYSCLWASLYLWANPFWSLKKNIPALPNPKKAYVIVANHQSMADILVLFNTFLHFKWVAKQSTFSVPLLGWNMRLNGYIPIQRGDSQSREKCIDLCKEWLQKGSSVLFFPEGTRSKDGNLLPFKPGAFKLALETGTDILPLVIKGSTHAIPKHSILLHRKSRMKVELLPPISVARFQGMDLSLATEKLSAEVRSIIQQKLDSLETPTNL